MVTTEWSDSARAWTFAWTDGPTVAQVRAACLEAGPEASDGLRYVRTLSEEAVALGAVRLTVSRPAVTPPSYAPAMSVSLYYSAQRATPLTDAESAAVERIVAAHMASFPYEYEESLYLYDRDADEPQKIVTGSTKMPFDPGRLMPVIAHVLDSVTELRRALPDAEWRVHMDDLDVPWDETEGYVLPGMRDAGLIAELAAANDEDGAVR
ncbi:hypothetical protein OG782_24140 [Streptomyces sp. NBC_00876]|uniref:hypothetical protein n=1 Tax=Streptomyces sp. NBC_00876 TaxID=2975853 RepID=UPI003867EB04|nr:hypothetical protein OG782_24140 [Streptomyces sp. NBC_00876]